MVKYRVSKYISIINIDNEYDAIPAKYHEGYFILHNKTEDSEYLINATIKYYIDKFSADTTEEEVLREVEENLQAGSTEIRETCSRFFNFLCKAKILVPADKASEDIASEPFYKEGDIIDQLRILKVISNRSYTDIYSAADIATGGVYVIKFLNRKKIVNEARHQKELEEMEQEFKMLKKAGQISCINKVYGFRKTRDNNAYIVLEYIEGKSLSAYMQDEAPMLTFPGCLHIIESIISAFSGLHQNRIIHGDIHSGNLLVTAGKEVKIIDFGLSRNVEIEQNEIVRCGGVYFYMPPERINTASFKKFAADPDLFSDVYQVGLLLYLVVYNVLPFDGFTWEDLAKSIREDDEVYPEFSFLNYPVPPELVNVIKKCLDKDPLKRYRNASEILADFKQYCFVEKELMEI